MIKWRLKRQGADDVVVSFEILKRGSGWKSILEEFSDYEWVHIFDTGSPTKVVTIGDIKFLSGSLLAPKVHEEENGIFRYYIAYNQVIITEIPLQTSDVELDVIISNRDYIDNQIPSLVIDANERSYVDVVLEHKRGNRTETCEILYESFETLKSVLKSKLSKELVIKYVKGNQTMKADFFDEELEDPSKFRCIADNGQIVCENVKTFMRFHVSSISVRRNSRFPSYVRPYLEVSFSHELTEVGQSVLEDLEDDILDRYEGWKIVKDPTLVAPVVSICQGSGVGKSKLSLETLKRHLGFYIVLRSEDQTGYPYKNYISDILFDLAKEYMDESEPLGSYEYSKCTVGKILNLVAKILTRYFNDFVELRVKKTSFRETIKLLACRFQNNTEISDALVDQSLMDAIYKLNNPGSQVITVDIVANYILNVLTNPKLCFTRFEEPLESVEIYDDDDDDDDDDEKAPLIQKLKLLIEKPHDNNEDIKKYLVEISKELEYFPFLLFIDEAELLAKAQTIKMVNERSINAFEVLRRALSYLIPSTRIMVSTLGTKSNVIDLNPDVIDESKRSRTRTKLPKPIVLYSNLNILSKQFPPHKVNPTYDSFVNPLFLKYLISLGHGIWSSLPYSSVFKTGRDKIVNGSAKTFDYVPVLWMILTGMAANPLSIEAGTFAANHMGYLLDISEDNKKLLVMYPPEPVLAIIAHNIIDTEIINEELFSILEKKFQAIDIDHGKIAEVFGGMIIARAIWKSPVLTFRYESYIEFLNYIKKSAPELNDIWEREGHILEQPTRRREIQAKIDKIKADLGKLKLSTSEIEDSLKTTSNTAFRRKIDGAIKKLKILEDEFNRNLPNPDISMALFDNYKIHSVDGFLHTLLNIPESENLNDIYGFPQHVLEGLVNGHQTVNLDSFSERLSFQGTHFEPKKPLVADGRIPDKSRFILTQELLKLCLVMQLIIKFPPGYYGLDYAVPVLLKDGSLTFIGVQIKRANANTGEDVNKMQARFHLVKCSFAHSPGTTRCPKCLDSETLKNIYANQISIVLSLDEAGSFSPFTSSKKYFKGTTDPEKLNLNRMLKSPETTVKMRKVGTNFFKPLITERVAHRPDILISKSLWDDKYVNLTKIKLTSDKEIDFVPDGFVHRQFCISIKGWRNYELLFPGDNENFEIAQKLMTPEGLSKSFITTRKEPKFIRKLLYDLSLTFPLYSDELRQARGENSWLDQLNDAVKKSKKSSEKKLVSDRKN